MKTFRRAILFQNAGIGDFLMALFLAEQLKENGVTEKSYIIVHKGAEFLRGFMEDYPYVSLLEISPRRPSSLLLLLALFGEKNLVVLPPTIGRFLLKTKFLAWALSKPFGFLVGFQDSGYFCETLYSKTIPYNIEQPFSKCMYDILWVLGIMGEEKAPRLNITPQKEIINRIGLSGKRYVFLHPRGSSDRRRLNSDEARALIDFILRTNSERVVLLSGAENEREVIENMVKSASEPERVFIAVGVTPVELAALIEQSEIFVGMDTGITHMSCFLGKRTIVIAKNATANWLPYYNENATVIFRFKEDERSQTSEDYMWEHQKGRLRPFRDVPINEVCLELGKILK